MGKKSRLSLDYIIGLVFAMHMPCMHSISLREKAVLPRQSFFLLFFIVAAVALAKRSFVAKAQHRRAASERASERPSRKDKSREGINYCWAWWPWCSFIFPFRRSLSLSVCRARVSHFLRARSLSVFPYIYIYRDSSVHMHVFYSCCCHSLNLPFSPANSHCCAPAHYAFMNNNCHADFALF